MYNAKWPFIKCISKVGLKAYRLIVHFFIAMRGVGYNKTVHLTGLYFKPGKGDSMSNWNKKQIKLKPIEIIK